MEHRFSPRVNRAKEIEWKDWGPEPFQQAEAAERPVLLSLSAVWCHWCHVMDETTYSDERVISLVKDRFVPIRVDNDQRPDINDRYNLGGWPTTAFLTPQGDLLTGGTYLPPDDMVENLKRVADWWDEHKGDPLPAAPQVKSQDRHISSHKDVDRAYQTIRATYDADHGGFGRAPKFPHTEVLRFLLDLDLVRQDPEIRVMVERSLLGMVEGGLYDPVEGGFFRYATQKDWSEPHYEKMLEDHACLLEVVVTAHQRWGSPDLLRAAIGAGDYLAGTLFTGTHFFGSQDADEHYYSLDREGRKALRAPFKDPVLYTDWNCQAARTMVRSGLILGKTTWVERGRQAFEAVLDKALKGDHLAHTDQPEAVTGLLTDGVSLGLAANLLWAVTGVERYRRASDQAADILLALMDEEGFRDRHSDGEAVLLRPLHPLQGNARAAQFFMERKDAFDDKQGENAVERAIRATSEAMDGQGLMACAHAHLVLVREISPVLIDLPPQAGGELLAKALVLDFPRKAYRFDIQAPGVVLCLGDRCLAPAKDAQELLLRARDL